MSEVSQLSVEPRDTSGTGNARRMRRGASMMPAVIYGGEGDSVMIQIAHKDMIKALEDDSFYTRLLTLDVGGKEERVILKNVQWHPAKNMLMHADFFRVSKDHKINIKVPVRCINEDKCLGIKTDGGMLIRSLNEVEVSCLPENIPSFIEVDIAEVRLGDHLHLSDIAWPEGVESVDLSHGEERDLSLLTIAEQRVEIEVEETPEGEEGEEGEGEEGEAGEAPADDKEAPKEDGGGGAEEGSGS